MKRSIAVGVGLLCWLLAAAGPVAAQVLTVSAAASLGPALREIGAAFERSNRPLRVQLNVAGSNALLAQIARGAPVDVFASADAETMDRAAAQRLLLAASRRDIARNSLVLVLPASAAAAAPGRLVDLAQVARAPQVRRIAIGNPTTVPAGRYAKTALEHEGLWTAVQDRLVFADDVRQVLAYVERGEVDAGFVYRTDALSAGPRIGRVIALPGAPPVHYPIAAIAAGAQPKAALDFIGFVAGPAGRAILARHGFEPP